MIRNSKATAGKVKAKKAKVLAISDRMTKAALIKELQKAQRWLKAAERDAAKMDLDRRKFLAESNNADLSMRRDCEVMRLEELVATFETAAQLTRPVDGVSRKLVRIVLLPGAANDEDDLRLTIDLVLDVETDKWDGNYYAVGYSGYLSAPDELYPFILRGDQIDYGTTGEADPLLKMKGRVVRRGEVFPYFSNGEARPDGRESYRVADVVTLMLGHA